MQNYKCESCKDTGKVFLLFSYSECTDCKKVEPQTASNTLSTESTEPKILRTANTIKTRKINYGPNPWGQTINPWAAPCSPSIIGNAGIPGCGTGVLNKKSILRQITLDPRSRFVDMYDLEGTPKYFYIVSNSLIDPTIITYPLIESLNINGKEQSRNYISTDVHKLKDINGWDDVSKNSPLILKIQNTYQEPITVYTGLYIL